MDAIKMLAGGTAGLCLMSSAVANTGMTQEAYSSFDLVDAASLVAIPAPSVDLYKDKTPAETVAYSAPSSGSYCFVLPGGYIVCV